MRTPCLLFADPALSILRGCELRIKRARRGALAFAPESIVLGRSVVAQGLAPRPNCRIFTNQPSTMQRLFAQRAGNMARVTGKVEMVNEAFARSAVVLLLLMLALACIMADSGPLATLGVWLAWMVLAVAIDAVSPRVGRTRDAAGSTTTALLFAAPLLQGAVLVYALWLVSAAPEGPMSIAMIAVVVGISGGTVGISAAHELVHRRGSLERGIAQAFMLLVSYPHFPIVHLRVHHPYVGTPLDPGTSRLNEPLVHFVGRAFVLAWHSGWRVERSRLARKGLTPWRMDNAILRALTLQAALYVAVGTAFGWIGLALFAGQSAVAIFLALTIDYTQHYGVVRRETASGRLERLRADHAWTSDHASNRSTFNLGLHADHHMKPTQGYSQLVNDDGALQAPMGYPGLLLLALVPPLWYRVMNTRLSANSRADSSESETLCAVISRKGGQPPRRISASIPIAASNIPNKGIAHLESAGMGAGGPTVPTVVVTVDALLPVSASVLAADTVAVLAKTLPSTVAPATLTTRANEALAPLARELFVAITLPVPPITGVPVTHPAGATRETKLVPGGNVSSSETVVAGDGPRFVTVMEYVRLLPAETIAAAVFVIARFA